MNNLVIGGLGFIGSHLVNRLKENGEYVKIIDNGTIGERNELNKKTDVCSIRDCRAIMPDDLYKIDRVYYMPAICNSDDFILYPRESFNVTVSGLKRIINFREQENFDFELIYFSTSEVYGESNMYVREDDRLITVLNERAGYDVGKLAGEALLYTSDIEKYKIIRPFNVYGPYEIRDGVIPKFLTQVKNGEDITIYNDGKQLRIFTYIDDFINGLESIVENGTKNIYNIVGNSEVTINDLAQTINKVVDKQIRWKYVDKDIDEITIRRGDNARLKSLGWEPKVDLKFGIEKVYEWIKRKNIKETKNYDMKMRYIF